MARSPTPIEIELDHAMNLWWGGYAALAAFFVLSLAFHFGGV